MSKNGPAKTEAQQTLKRKGAFQPGISGNPRGRPLGSRHKTTVAVLALLEGQAELLTQKCISAAMQGDMTALTLCLSRLCAPLKENTLRITLPRLDTAEDVPKAMARILSSVTKGEIDPGQGEKLVSLIEAFQAAVVMVELEQRLKILEQEGENGHEKQ